MRVALLVALLGAVAARRADTDFEFDDDAVQTLSGEPAAAAAAAAGRRPRRYVYDPHNPLCQSLSCGAGTSCLLRDAFTALCADRQELRSRGDVIVPGGGEGEAWGGGGGEEEDEVFYEPAPPDNKLDAAAVRADKCVGCGAGGAGGFVCGSDNRTYSSLCRLDLHNCVRRPRAPVAPACPGFCPCGPAAPASAPPRPRRDRARPRADTDYQYEDVLLLPTDPPPHKPATSKEWWRRQAEASHNSALPERELKRDRARARARKHEHEHEHDEHNKRRRLKEGSSAAAAVLPADSAAVERGCRAGAGRLAERLVDWFGVLRARAGQGPDGAGRAAPPARGWPRGCKPEVRWMFAHLDLQRDGLLDDTDLYALSHDESEKCLRPFLTSCVGAGRGRGPVTRGAWCACLGRAARPCAALARAHRARGAEGYVPTCDTQGYYAPRQCHAALGVCWCVTPHGTERPHSRTRGPTRCESESVGEDGSEGAPDDDEDAPGSGDNELRF